MINKQISLRLITTAFVALGTIASALSQKAPQISNGSGAYATKKYRDLFQELGYSPQQSKAKIEAAFRQLFYGDTSQAIYFKAGQNASGPMAYVSDVAHFDVRSEGMSYAMMIAVQLNKKAEFDALWNWSMTHMYISSPVHPAEGYFSWSLKTDGTPNEETPAPDGEEYYVMALYFASGRWGNGVGIYNYRKWADKILSTMRHHPLKEGATKFGQRSVSVMVNEQRKMIRFVPNTDRFDFSDPSYHLPAFYELWARWGPVKDRAFWAAAADSSRSYFKKAAHPQTGLSPDYADFDGKPYATRWSNGPSHFGFDTWRTASNWSVDWSWWHKDPSEQELSDRIQNFFVSQGINTYGCQYSLDGKVVIDERHASGLVSTNAVASLAATHAVFKEFTAALWNMPIPQKWVERYYDGLLYIMSLMHCSGNYRIYDPK